MEETLAMQIARRIRRLRRDQEITQLDLSRATGIAQSAISSLERGKTPNPGVVTLDQIARALGVKLVDLLVDPPADEIGSETATDAPSAF